MPQRQRRFSDERGALSVELLFLTPVLVLVLLVVLAAGRIAIAENAMQAAANAAAREASLARTTPVAQSNAAQAAAQTLNQDGYTCTTLTITINDSGINAPLGELGEVGASVTCTLQLSDLGIPALGNTMELSATATSPVDAFRERN